MHFSRGSSWPRDWNCVFYLSQWQVASLPSAPPGKCSCKTSHPSQLPNQGGDCHQTWEQPTALRAPGSPPWARVHLHRAVTATAHGGSSPQATGHTQTAQGCLLRRTCLQGRHRRQLHFVSQRKLNKMRRQRGRFQIKEQKNNPWKKSEWNRGIIYLIKSLNQL